MEPYLVDTLKMTQRRQLVKTRPDTVSSRRWPIRVSHNRGALKNTQISSCAL